MKRVSHLPLLRVNVSSIALHVAMCNWKNTVCSDKVHIKTVAQFCEARVMSQPLKSLLNMKKTFCSVKDQTVRNGLLFDSVLVQVTLLFPPGL